MFSISTQIVTLSRSQKTPFVVTAWIHIRNNVIANFKILALMENAGRLRKAGVKVIGSLMLWDTAANMMRISASPELREKLAASIMDVMEQLQLDGLFLQWMWPGCPKVN
jgi:GH18 family chitinase